MMRWSEHKTEPKISVQETIAAKPDKNLSIELIEPKIYNRNYKII